MTVLSSLLPMLQADASFGGIMYSATLADQVVTAGKYEAFYFLNPSATTATTVTIQFNTINGTSDQALSIDIIKGVTTFTDTGSLTPRNNDSGCADNSTLSSVLTAVDATNPISGGVILYSYRNQTTLNLNLVGGISIQPGHNVVVRLLNNTTSDANITFNFNWWEITTN